MAVVISSSGGDGDGGAPLLCCRTYNSFVDLLLVTITPLIMAKKELFCRKCTFFGRWTSVWKLLVLWSIPDITEPQ